jgi:hypothetical protein
MTVCYSSREQQRTAAEQHLLVLMSCCIMNMMKNSVTLVGPILTPMHGAAVR